MRCPELAPLVTVPFDAPAGLTLDSPRISGQKCPDIHPGKIRKTPKHWLEIPFVHIQFQRRQVGPPFNILQPAEMRATGTAERIEASKPVG